MGFVERNLAWHCKASFYLSEGFAHTSLMCAEKCRRPFSDPPGDLIDRWEHRDGRGRAPRANGSDIPFSAIHPDLRGGKGVKRVRRGRGRGAMSNTFPLLP